MQLSPTTTVDDPAISAKAAGLRYVSDAMPGIRRKRSGGGFRYLDPDGRVIRDKATLARIKAIVIPPAWKDVWICSNSNGHLQVTGRDARGRKQSRYHPRWREVRDETKYQKMLAFGKSLPKIRKRVAKDLALADMSRRKILALVVSLLEATFIRVGNIEYARENESYGLTTMRTRHVHLTGSKVTFAFKGKSGVQHSVDLSDRRLANAVRRCMDLPGYELFQYIDQEGGRHVIDAADVNDYLNEISGEHFTAKDFRTWAGTILACTMLRTFEAFQSETEAKRNLVQAIKQVAKQLGNTPSVCRKCYIHPAIIERYLAGSINAGFSHRVTDEMLRSPKALRRFETPLMRMLSKAM
jgi:DNA topoisomerase-1